MLRIIIRFDNGTFAGVQTVRFVGRMVVVAHRRFVQFDRFEFVQNAIHECVVAAFWIGVGGESRIVGGHG